MKINKPSRWICFAVGIGFVLTLLSLLYVREVNSENRYPNPCQYEFCGGAQMQWGWPLPFYFDQGVNTETCLGCLSFIFDMKSPINFLADLLIFTAPIVLSFYIYHKKIYSLYTTRTDRS